MRLISAAEEQMTADRMQELRDRNAVLAVQNADLLATVLSLKANGASAPAVPLTRSQPNRITEVISDVAGTNGRLRTALTAYARTEQRNGTHEDDIVQALLHWGEDDEGTPE